jgi:hypothetical protein
LDEEHDEESLLLNKSQVVEKQTSPRSLFFIGGAAAVLFLTGVAMNNQTEFNVATLSSSPDPLQSSILHSSKAIHFNTFSVINEDIEQYGPTGGDYPWMVNGFLVEPYTSTSFEATHDGSWTVNHPDGTTTTNVDAAAQFVTSFEEVGTYKIVFVDSVTSDTETINVFVKYVRREIRSMREGKRTAFKKAFREIILITDEVTGKTLYGEDFTPFSKMAALHTNWVSFNFCTVYFVSVCYHGANHRKMVNDPSSVLEP